MIIELGQYKGFGLERPNVKITDKEISNYINKIRENYKKEVEKEGSIEKEDCVIISYDGYHEGEYIPQISRKNHHSKIGEGFFLEEFEQHLLGLKKGDTVEFDIVLPNNKQYMFLANETVHFKVKIISVMNQILPKLTDEIVRSFGIEGVTSIVELKEYAKDKIEYQKMMVESTKFINEIMAQIIDNSKVVLKDEEVEQLKYEVFKDFKKQIENNNCNLKIYLAYTKKTEEEILEECKLEAETYLVEKSIIEKIAQLENITLKDEEKEQHKNVIKEDELNQLLYQKVVCFLLKENTKNDIDYSSKTMQ